MKPISLLILVLEAGAAVALVSAAISGGGDLHSDGLHVAKLANERFGGTVLAVCVFSCLVASVLLVRVTRSWSRAEGWGFLVAILLGWLASSAYANAAGDVTLNGASTEWISWPARIWLLVIIGVFVLRACHAGRGAALPPKPNSAPDRG